MWVCDSKLLSCSKEKREMLPITDCFQEWYRELRGGVSKVLSASGQTANASIRSERKHFLHTSVTSELTLQHTETRLESAGTGDLPAATVTGHCVLPSKRWPCPVCPAGPSRAPRWTCPCWRSGRYLKQWSGSPGCGPISFPLARSSLGTAQTQQHGRKTITTYMNNALNRRGW